MLRTVLKSKLHRLTVTQADLEYEGSVTIDENLMDAADLLPPDLHQVVIAGSILSLLLTPFLVRAAPTLVEALVARRLARGAAGPAEADGEEEPGAAGRVIVVGFGHAGRTLTRTLRSLGVDYVVVESNASNVEAAREAGEPIVFGDATRPPVLQRLGVVRAKLVAVAISDPLATRRIVSRIHAMAAHTPVLARTRYVQEVDVLESAGARAVVAEEYEAALELVARVLEHFQIPAAAIHNFTSALREEGYGAIRGPTSVPIDPWLVELLDRVETEWLEVPDTFRSEVSLVDLDVRARTGANILAIERAGVATPNPTPVDRLRAGDRLLVLGNASAHRSLSALLASGSGVDRGDREG